MKKKSNKKVLIFLGIIALVVAIYFICFHRGTTEENKKTLTVAENITLNEKIKTFEFCLKKMEDMEKTW